MSEVLRRQVNFGNGDAIGRFEHYGSPSFRNNNYAPIICTFYDPKKYLGIYISILLEIWLTSSVFMFIIESWKTK